MAHLTAELSQDLLTTYPYTSASCRTHSRPSSGPSALKSDTTTTILSDSEEEHYEMVQTYNAVPVSVEHDDDADDRRGAEHEGSALLGSSASSAGLARNRAQKEGPATLTSSVGNLANTIIGSGELRSLISLLLSLPLYLLNSPYLRRIFLLTVSCAAIIQACLPFLGYVLSLVRLRDGSSCPLMSSPMR